MEALLLQIVILPSFETIPNNMAGKKEEEKKLADVTLKIHLHVSSPAAQIITKHPPFSSFFSF